MKETVYLDNNATTMVPPEVIDAMLPFLGSRYGNPSSMHDFGGDVSDDVEQARDSVRRMLGADNDYEIVFTSGATESDNLAIMGTLGYHKDKRHVITTRVEHPAVLNLCRQLERQGYRVTYVPVDARGNLDLHYLFEAVDDDTAIVSVMYANNETGVIFPVEQIGSFLKERGIPFHVDGVQAVGKIPVDVNKINCDYFAISGHKFHAPKGTGALYVRRGTRMRPMQHGGHQERGRRPGTLNVPGIVAMGKAADLAMEHLDGEDHVAVLRDTLEKGLLRRFPNASLNGDPALRVPNTTNIGFEFVEGEAILLYLNEKGIAASSGSACSSGSLEPSHVLRAMGVPFTSAHGSIRYSLSRYTTEKEIDYTLSVMPEVIEKLLELSPFWDNEKKEGKPVTGISC